MRRLVALLLTAGVPAVSWAQVSPMPGLDDPRLQTVSYDPSRPVRLVAFPGATLTVMLPPGEAIVRAAISDPNAFEVKVTPSGDSLNILARRPGAVANLSAETAERRYDFELATGEGLAAAYVVRFVPPSALQPGIVPDIAVRPSEAELTGEYRLSGERVLRPSRIGDDGERTYIEWGEYQSLPAVFGVGANGDEEVVDGYMRDGVFVIDRVYERLVFRIDKKRARARRTEGLGG